MRHWQLALVALLLCGCGGREARIRKNRAAFESWPPHVQALVKQGRVDVGFTPEQVRVSLGSPDRVYVRKTAASSQEVWAYGLGRAGTSVGIGYGTGGYGSRVGVGVGVSSAPPYDDERVRVVFENGLVAAVETREK